MPSEQALDRQCFDMALSGIKHHLENAFDMTVSTGAKAPMSKPKRRAIDERCRADSR